MLTEHQIETFKTTGILRLEKFLPAEVVHAAQTFIFGLAEKEGAWQGKIGQDSTWQLDETSKRPKFTKPMMKEELKILETSELLAVIDILVEGERLKVRRKPSLLFTLPRTRTRPAWHTDAPRQPHGMTPGVQMFTCLDAVVPGGGGTLAVSGSHRLVDNGEHIRSKEIKTLLMQYEYFQTLFSMKQPTLEELLATSGTAEDIELQVVEMHGEPRDVVLMDLRILHTGSSNTTTRPRLMVTERYYLESALD
ncbi:MAG: phytanoyl-CoA dioxygenase family protein [Chloroflexota bacterium]